MHTGRAVLVSQNFARRTGVRVGDVLHLQAPAGTLDVEVAGRCHRVPLGPLPLGGWRLADAHEGDDRFVVLETAAGSTPPFLRGLRLGPRVELCHGDALSRAREEAPWLLASLLQLAP